MSKQHTEEKLQDKMEIIKEIKYPLRLRPVATVIVLFVAIFILWITIGHLGNFIRELTSDYLSALSSLVFTWNFGFALYFLLWHLVNSIKINKVLFPQLEHFLQQNEMESYEGIKAEANQMVKEAYKYYYRKYYRLKKIFMTALKVSLVFLLLTLVVEFIF